MTPNNRKLRLQLFVVSALVAVAMFSFGAKLPFSVSLTLRLLALVTALLVIILFVVPWHHAGLYMHPRPS